MKHRTNTLTTNTGQILNYIHQSHTKLNLTAAERMPIILYTNYSLGSF